MQLKLGDVVRVWPRPGVRVQSHAEAFGRFLPDEGADLVFNDWVHDRLMDGSFLLVDPRPVQLPAKEGDQ